MGKLMDRLQKQLDQPEHRQDAEECIEIYNWLKANDPEGAVWSSKWEPLVEVRFKGYPSDDRTYKLNFIGKAVLKGIQVR